MMLRESLFETNDAVLVLDLMLPLLVEYLGLCSMLEFTPCLSSPLPVEIL
jgi:hypothetical protein